MEFGKYMKNSLLYALVTALAVQLRELLPENARIVAICHSTCLRQFQKNELEKATKQMEEAQRIFEYICGQNLEDKERKKTKNAIVITCIVIVALYVALFLNL